MIGNLLDDLLKFHEVEPDPRFHHWAKRIVRVNTEKASGYAFEGNFVRGGTLEYDPGPALYLVAVSAGSRKHQRKYYEVIYMDGEGNLSRTGIKTDNETPGWALRIRDAVAAKLAEIKPDANVNSPVQTSVPISLDDLEHALKLLRDTLPEESNNPTLQAAARGVGTLIGVYALLAKGETIILQAR